MRRALVLAALVAGLAAGPAEATTTITGSARAPQLQRWVMKSKVPTPDLAVEVVDARCPAPYDAVACATWDNIVYVSPALTGSAARQTLMHELGHVYDNVLMTDERRAAVASVMSWSMPWLQPELDHAAPNELFANLYSDCALAHTLAPYRPWHRGFLITSATKRVKAGGCALIAQSYA